MTEFKNRIIQRANELLRELNKEDNLSIQQLQEFKKRGVINE